MLEKIREKLIPLGLGAMMIALVSYLFSSDLAQSLVLGVVALVGGLMALGFYAAGQAK